MASTKSKRLLTACIGITLLFLTRAAEWLQIDAKTMVCLSGARSDLLCTMQMENADKLQFTIDPLLQSRYMRANGSLNSWLPSAPSVFPDQELTISSSVGGFISGKTGIATAHIDYLWCSEATCHTVLDLAYIKNSSGDCQLNMAFAAFPNSIVGFGLPHSVGTDFKDEDFEYHDVTPYFSIKSEITSFKHRCNASPGLQSLDVRPGGVHVTPVRSSAVLLSKQTAPLMAHTAKLPDTDTCATFIYPNSDFYASADLFGEMKPCQESDSEQAFILEGVLDEDHKYTWMVDWSSVQPRAAAIGFEAVSMWVASMDCRPLLGLGERNNSDYVNMEEVTVKTPGVCIPELTDACRVAFKSSKFNMVALNITHGFMNGSTYQADGGALGGDTSKYPMLFHTLVHRLIAAEAVCPAVCLAERVWVDGWNEICCDERQVEMNETCHNSYNFTGKFMPGEGTQLLDWPYKQNDKAYCQDSFITKKRDPMTTPEFLAKYTTTRWANTTSLSGVHGFGVFETIDNLDPLSLRLTDGWTKPWDARISANLKLLEPEVAQRLQEVLTQLLADTESILRAPGAAFILVISLTTTVAGILQVVEIENSIVHWHISWPLKVALRVTLVALMSAVALMPVAFAFAGERSTFLNNRNSGTTTYEQIWVATQGQDNENSPLGGDGHKLVALVAFQTQYTVSFTSVGIVYLVTVILCALLLIACAVFVFVFGGKSHLHGRHSHPHKTDPTPAPGTPERVVVPSI